MQTDKLDLRIVKTKKAIKNAFITLVPRKGYEGITVKDIAGEAMINRNTFYLHYKDKPDLVETLAMESMERLNVCLSLHTVKDNTVSKDMVTSILLAIFQEIESDLHFFKVLLDLNTQPSFISYLKERLKIYMLDALGYQNEEADIKVGLEYIVSGLVGIICSWIKESDDLNYTAILEQLQTIHFHNIQEVFFNEKMRSN